jgi:vitamin B12 transporter
VVHDRIVFNGNPGDVLRYVAFANHQYTFANHWNVQASIDWNHIIGKIEEYEGDPVEDRLDIATSLQREFSRGRMSVTFRKPFITDIEAPLLPYVGGDLFLLRTTHQTLQLSANASKNFRAPTLNDRYWQDVGNKDLHPETSHAGELGLSWTYDLIKFSSSAFYQVVDNWIQWSPTPGSGIYQPENIKQVHARGAEMSLEVHSKQGEVLIHFKGSYQYTKSTTEKALESETESIGKQLIYTPVHTASAFIINQMRSWSLNLFMQYAGKRFTESTNNEGYTLDPYAIVDVSIGKLFITGRNSFQARFAVRNVFDTEYQMYSGRAMPGRNFNLQISYQLNHKSN